MGVSATIAVFINGVGDTQVDSAVYYDAVMQLVTEHYPETRKITFHAVPEDNEPGLVVQVPEIRQRALNLLHALDKERLNALGASGEEVTEEIEDEAPLRLIIAAYDIGGLVVKQALILAEESPHKFQWVIKGTAAVLFFDMPNKPLDAAEWERYIARIFADTHHRVDYLSFIQVVSATAADIDLQFIPAARNYRIFDFQKQVAVSSPCNSRRPDISDLNDTELECTLNDQGTQVSIDKPKDSLLNVLSRHQSINFGDFGRYSRFCLRALVELGYQPRLLRSSVEASISLHQMEWVKESAWYRSWLETHQSEVLHVVGPPGAGTTLLASKVLQLLKSENQLVLSYSIGVRERHDVLTKGLFYSLYQQVLPAIPITKYASRLCTWLLADEIFSKEAMRGLLCSLLSSHSGESIFCVIHGIGQLEQQVQHTLRQDLDLLRSSAQKPLKVLITSESPDIWSEIQKPYSLVRLDEMELQRSEMRVLSDTRLAVLARRKPVWGPVLRDANLTNRFSAESKTILEVAWKLDFIESTDVPGTKEAVRGLISRLPTSLEEYHKCVIDSISKDSPLALSVIPWITHSMRPMSPAELAVCGALEAATNNNTSWGELSDNITWDPEKDICLPLSSLCRVLEGSMRIRHRSYVHPLLAETKRQIPEDVHGHLFSKCLEYLELFMVRPEEGNETGEELDLQSFVEYSVLFWPDHCKRMNDTEKATSKARRLLENPESFDWWLQKYRRYATVWHGKQLIPRSTIEVASYFGLHGVALYLLEKLNLSEERALRNAQSAMNLAVEQGHFRVVSAFVRRCTDLATLGALQMAARKGYLGCIKALIKAGLDMDDFGDAEYNPLLEAVRHGRYDAFQLLKAEGSNLNVVSQTAKLTPLHLASKIGHIDLVQGLLELGVSMTSADDSGFDALKYAAAGGFGIVIKTLLDMSAKHSAKGSGHDEVDINSQARSGDTALHLAVAGGHLATVRLLLDEEARARVRNEDHYTPLHLACELGFFDIAELLIHAVPDPKSRDNETTATVPDPCPTTPDNLELPSTLTPLEENTPSPIELAVKHGHLQIVKLLLESSSIATTDSATRALLLACQLGDVGAAEVLLHWHRDLHGLDNSYVPTNELGNTPLHVAAGASQLKILELLLSEHYIPVNMQNSDNNTALHLAADAGHVTACSVLLSKGASAMVTNEEATPVLLAATNGHEDTVKVILEHQPDSANGLLLHRAIENGSRVIVDAVLAVNSGQAEKFVDWQDDKGDTAVHIAVISNRTEFITVLHKAGADMGVVNSNHQTPIFLAAEAGLLDIIRALLGTGADVKADEPNNDGYSPLMFVCWEPNESSADIVKELLAEELLAQGQVNVNRMHLETGRTALHFATDDDQDDTIASLLLEAGADPNIKNARGSTPLFLAAEVGRLETVMQLIEHDANVGITNNSNSTALHRACQGGHINCIEALISAGANINHESDRGFTPLGIAAHRRKWNAVDKLIELDADLAIALLAAIRRDRTPTKVIKRLWQRRTEETMKSLNSPGGKGCALLVAAMTRTSDDDDDESDDDGNNDDKGDDDQNYDDLLELFLGHDGVDITVYDNTGHSPLIGAVFAGKPRAVDLMLKKGANPNERSREGHMPLLARVVMEGNLEITQMLLTNKTICVAEMDSRKHTALYWAARQNPPFEFDSLFGATKELPNHPLVCSDAIHGAIAAGNKEILKLLLDVKDINANTTDSDGWTPVRAAASWGHQELEEMIMTHSSFELSAVGEFDPPSGWDVDDKSRALEVQAGDPCIVTVAHTITRIDDWGDEEHDWAVARANRCLPHDQDLYFEVEVQKGFEFSELLGIGVCYDTARLDGMLGFFKTTSWAFHADDGRCFGSQPCENLEKYGKDSQYKGGDIVGCGFTASDKSIYFTLNGEHLGVAFSGIKGKLYPAVFMNTQTKGVQLKANFTGPFIYNPDEIKEGSVEECDSSAVDSDS